MTAGHNGKGVAERAWQEAGMLRREIQDGRFQRSMAMITGLSAVVSGAEAYTQHRRGAFANRLMWTPIWLMPPAVAAATAAVVSERAARRLLPAISAVVIADGVLGFVYHLRGIGRMPGGFRLGQYNIVMGPPIFAPLLMCSVGVAGVLTGALQRSRPAHKRSSLLRAGIATAVRYLAANREAIARQGDGLRALGVTGRNGTSRASGLADLATRAGERVGRGKARRRGVDHHVQRGLAVTTAVLGAVAGGEAYFEHMRGSFNNRLMWTPIWLAPPMIAAAAGAAVSERVARRVLPVASAVTLADGALGFTLHLRGLDRMPGDAGNTDFKITMGPPLFAPLLFSAVGLFGLVASLLRQPRGK